MAEIINQITIFFEQLILAIGYPGIYAVMFAENVFTPIPTEPLLPLAGILASQGQLSFIGVWVTAVAGATSGSLVLYAIGRRGGDPMVRTLVRRYGRYFGMTESGLDRAVSLFNRYGGWVVFFGRWIPFVRPTVSLVSGVSRLPLYIFLPFTILSSAPATVIYIIGGYLLGENWRAILDVIDQLEPFILVGGLVIGVLLLGFVIARFLRARAVLRREPAE